MLQRIIGFRKRDLEQDEDFMYRVHAKIRELRGRIGMMGWDQRVHRSVYRWGGHVARMSLYDPTRLTYRVFKHNNIEQVRHFAKYNKQQGHGRRFHVWRWERAVQARHGSEWFLKAADKRVWESDVDAFILWRREHR